MSAQVVLTRTKPKKEVVKAEEVKEEARPGEGLFKIYKPTEQERSYDKQIINLFRNSNAKGTYSPFMGKWE